MKEGTVSTEGMTKGRMELFSRKGKRRRSIRGEGFYGVSDKVGLRTGDERKSR